ncbi:MAG TPA: ABC transporter ATP-binding protein [Beijerinckiaceae bacterium]|jgi:iron(III) transport system ATP-binding protein
MRSAAGPAGRAVAVEIERVDLSYGETRVLKDVSLRVEPGEFFAFLGPSGCGKTTLLRLIAGFAEAGRGRVLVGGADISRLPPWRRDVGMVFQSYALWPHMTVRQNVAFGLEERRLPRAEVARRVDAALALVGLAGLADRRPSQLSGGQQQRVAVARTVAVEPKVLLLDEPLSNLDAMLRVQVRRELADLQRRLGVTTIFVTHDQEEANTICDRVAVMREGTIRQVGTPMELYRRPADLFVAGFLGSINVLDGHVVESGSERAFALAGGTQVPIPPQAPVPPGAKLVFRPQDAALDPEGPGHAAIAGTVARREFLGASVRYGVTAAGAELLVDAPFRTGERLREVGTPVTVGLRPEAALWLAE